MSKRRDVSEVVDITPPAKKKKKKGWLIFLIVILAIIVAAVALVYGYFKSLGINFLDRDSATGENNTNSMYDELSDDQYNEYHGMITAMQNNSSLSGILSGWYNNKGDLMSSRNIINVLIIGIDASGNKPMEGNSDAMMLASIDKSKGTITLCSFLRDSYTYFESNGNPVYAKLNAAYAYGGAKCLISAVENNYKIKVDYYAAVDFDAFEKVIDAIGGINITVTQEEAEAIEKYANIKNVPYGENVLLNGQQALLFSRTRKIYATGDVQRTKNQRRVINAIINKAKSNLSLTTLNNIVSTLAPYVYTDVSTTKMISLGTNAILGKWYNFQVYSMEAPQESAREGCSGDTSWVWVVDYPYAAQYVQKQIYGETNITIPDGTISTLDVFDPSDF